MREYRSIDPLTSHSSTSERGRVRRICRGSANTSPPVRRLFVEPPHRLAGERAGEIGEGEGAAARVGHDGVGLQPAAAAGAVAEAEAQLLPARLERDGPPAHPEPELGRHHPEAGDLTHAEGDRRRRAAEEGADERRDAGHHAEHEAAQSAGQQGGRDGAGGGSEDGGIHGRGTHRSGGGRGIARARLTGPRPGRAHAGT